MQCCPFKHDQHFWVCGWDPDWGSYGQVEEEPFSNGFPFSVGVDGNQEEDNGAFDKVAHSLLSGYADIGFGVCF